MAAKTMDQLAIEVLGTQTYELIRLRAQLEQAHEQIADLRAKLTAATSPKDAAAV